MRSPARTGTLQLLNSNNNAVLQRGISLDEIRTSVESGLSVTFDTSINSLNGTAALGATITAELVYTPSGGSDTIKVLTAEINNRFYVAPTP